MTRKREEQELRAGVELPAGAGQRAGAELPAGAGRFFRSLVIVGGSLALGCSGQVERVSGGEGSGGDSSGGGSGVGAGGTSTGANGAGGNSAGGNGSGVGGTSAGGSTVLFGGAAGHGSEDECLPQQWACTGVPLQQATRPGGACGYELPENCSCNPGAPVELEDCPDGTTLVCLAAVADHEGKALPEGVLPFQCNCAPEPTNDSDCSPCATVGVRTAICGVSSGRGPTGDERKTVLCGCELTLLR